VDRALGSFLESLRRSGRYDNATIVLTSDHGARAELGSDNPLKVPLVIRTPRQTQRQDIEAVTDVRAALNGVFSVSCSGR
jgi:arylsulfatase A-like enzyme